MTAGSAANADDLELEEDLFAIKAPWEIDEEVIERSSETSPAERPGGRWSIAVDALGSELEPDDSRSGWRVVDEHDTGYRVSVAYEFRDRWLVELGYADLGRAHLENLNPAIEGREAVEYSAASAYVGRLLRAPEKLVNVHLKAGASAVNTTATGQLEDHQLHNLQFSFGGALRFRLGPRAELHLEYEHYDEDVERAGLGLRYDF